MPTYCLTVAYDGTDFVGWQRQKNGLSIQSVLEEALARLLGHPVSCRAAGRTDAGVHASGQVVSFRSERVLSGRALMFGTNQSLPQTVAVVCAAEAADDFDARHSASGKLYRYQIWNAPVPSPLHRRTHWHVYNGRPLDLAAMQAAASRLVGHHDFRAFRAANCERTSTVRLVRRLDVFYAPESCEPLPGSGAGSGPLPAALYIDVEATAFLRNMVRILAGTLVEVGRGRMTPDDVAAALASGDRERAGPTAPAHGLRLCRVDYGPRKMA